MIGVIIFLIAETACLISGVLWGVLMWKNETRLVDENIRLEKKANKKFAYRNCSVSLDEYSGVTDTEVYGLALIPLERYQQMLIDLSRYEEAVALQSLVDCSKINKMCTKGD